MTREDAEKHWEFIYGLIMVFIKVLHFLFVEAMIHGAKHGKEERIGS